MKALLTILLLCLSVNIQALTISVGDRFLDRETGVMYTVREVRMDKYVFMTDHDDNNMLSLTKVDGKEGEYILEPSRQADEPTIPGAEFGWPVKYYRDGSKALLGFYTPQGELLYSLRGVPEGEITPEREDYSFDVSFITGDLGYVDQVFVKGYTPFDESPYLEYKHELVERLAEVPDADEATNWVNDETDINFDGFPDLLIFLGRNCVGRIEEFYAAYVWDEEYKCFALVPGFDEIGNPVFHPDSKTITSTVRTDAAEMTTWTYIWDGWQLEIIDEKISNLFDDE